jgi:hypothetical protein
MTPPAQIDGPEWVLVPREPTQAMCEAGVAAGVKASPEPWCPKTWAAMIAAAPQPKAEGCDADEAECCEVCHEPLADECACHNEYNREHDRADTER